MKSYLFSVGNSSEGHIGLCARVRAKSRKEALKLLDADGDCVMCGEPVGRGHDAGCPVAVARALIRKARAGAPAYPDLCRDPNLCAGRGFCPRDPACNE